MRAVAVPVTLKMRMGWDHNSLNAPRLAQHRRGMRHPPGHRAWPHPADVLHRHRRLGLRPPGEGGGAHPGHRQWRHPDRRGRRGGAAPVRRRWRDDRARLLWPALVPAPGGRASCDRARRRPSPRWPSRSASCSRITRDMLDASRHATRACASRASMSPGIPRACRARPSSASQVNRCETRRGGAATLIARLLRPADRTAASRPRATPSAPRRCQGASAERIAA